MSIVLTASPDPKCERATYSPFLEEILRSGDKPVNASGHAGFVKTSRLKNLTVLLMNYLLTKETNIFFH